jgi:hypothetical protein
MGASVEWMQSILSILLLVLRPPLSARTSYYIDGQNTVPVMMPYGAVLRRSISEVATVAVAGDTIMARGMVDNGPGGSGLEVACSDVVFNAPPDQQRRCGS